MDMQLDVRPRVAVPVAKNQKSRKAVGWAVKRVDAHHVIYRP